MRIIGPASASSTRVAGNLAALNPHTRFLSEMFNPLWNAALSQGLDPVGMVAQAGKETGWGNYPGKVKPEFRNTCGLKVPTYVQPLFPNITTDDNSLAHQIFPSWEVGTIAHAQHLCAYTGQPVTGLNVDPRYGAVLAKGLRLENWSELGGTGRWAPSPTYGVELEALIRKLQV